WDPVGERVVGMRQKVVGDLVLQEHPTGDAPRELVAATLLANVDVERVVGPELERLLARIDLLRRVMPELDLPELEARDLLPDLCARARSVADLRHADWIAAALERLD